MIGQRPVVLAAFDPETLKARRQRAAGGTRLAREATSTSPGPRREIGPMGTAVRLVLGLLLVGSIVYGQLLAAWHPAPITWALGLIGFPALVLVWHIWRIRRNSARFYDAGPFTFVLSLALPLAVYLIGWFVPTLGFTSDATIIFVGSCTLLAAFRGAAGCEFLALSNWLLRRRDQLACAIFTPIDVLEQREAHP